VTGEQILVVEDELAIATEVELALSAHGYLVECVETGRAALAAAEAEPRPDLVILDLGLPDLDGVHVCRTLRAAHPELPIVIVTARDADIDIVVGLDAGATDYMVKPFATTVLLARVRAHLRRPDPVADDEVIVVGTLRVDGPAHRAYVDGVEVELRPKEFALLRFLVENAGRVMTRDHLLREVWDLQWESSTKTLDMHIHAVRRRLGDRPGGGAWISTIRSIGYRFELS
jgi:DNA-binding response OmpR family regulator